jgi:hypothetical protein
MARACAQAVVARNEILAQQQRWLLKQPATLARLALLGLSRRLRSCCLLCGWRLGCRLGDALEALTETPQPLTQTLAQLGQLTPAEEHNQDNRKNHEMRRLKQITHASKPSAYALYTLREHISHYRTKGE